MIVLALDTALEACSAAVVADDAPCAARVEPMMRGHQERLAPMVAEVMAEAGFGFDALHRIAVTVGPGSFTGLRVGLAFAKAMSLALDIACIGVGTLEALMASAPEAREEPLLLTVLDAPREHVYLQAFSRTAPLTDPANLSLTDALVTSVRLGATASTPMLGSGAHLLAQAFRLARDQPPEGPPVTYPGWIDPVALARIAAVRPAPAGRPAPMYLRAPDAKTIAERAELAEG